MVKIKDHKFSRGFLSLISLLITLAIIVILFFGIYFGFNKIRFSNNSQSGESEQITPQNEIEKAKEAKNLLESQQKSLKESTNK